MAKKFIIDQYWDDVGNFLNSQLQDPSPIIADSAFRAFGLTTENPTEENLAREDCKTFVYHKDSNFTPALVDFIEEKFNPIFANEVFVIFSKDKKFPKLTDSTHLTSYRNKFQMIRSKVSDLYTGVTDQRKSVYLGGNRVISKTVFGQKMFLDSRDLSLTPHIIMDGFWERWITNVFIGLIDKDTHVVDIGANVGYYTLLAASKLGAKGKLTSFEANPGVAEILFDNVHINGFGQKCHVVQKAVYSENKQIDFKVFGKFLGSSSIYATDETAKNFNDRLNIIPVEAVTLDSFFPPGEKIDLIKMDAEGAEPYILKGATRVLKENPNIKILMEFSPGIIEVAYESVERFFDDLQRVGFKMYLIDYDSSLKYISKELAHTLHHCDVLLKR
jgi:FkbM family methyltransferase